MKLLKMILAVVGVAVIGISTAIPVKADRWEELKKAIAVAEDKLASAKANLYLANMTAYRIFMDQPLSEGFQRSEKFLREKHPKEYWDYMCSKGDLEELKELLFYATMNDLSQ